MFEQNDSSFNMSLKDWSELDQELKDGYLQLQHSTNQLGHDINTSLRTPLTVFYTVILVLGKSGL